jgi:predicted ATPase
MSFLSALHELASGGSQFLIATHSPIILAYPEAWIYRVGTEGIRRVAYRETDHYKITRDFLLRTDQMLSILLRDEPGTE